MVPLTHLVLTQNNIIVVNPRPDIPDHLQYDVVVTDFGLSVLHDARSKEQHSIRAGYLRAPEQISPEDHGRESVRPTYKSDVFTFAALCYQVSPFKTCNTLREKVYPFLQLYTTVSPYHEKVTNHMMEKAISQLEPLDRETTVMVNNQPVPVRIPDDLWDIIQMCWKGPDERPDARIIEERLKCMERAIPFSVPSQ